MKALINNKIKELSANDLQALIAVFKKVHIDIGTGDGRFVYKSAKSNPENFYIGVDPSQKQLEVNLRKIHREKLKNCLFVVGSIEVFPAELFGLANSVSVLFPWGSLLRAVVDANEDFLHKIKNLFSFSDNVGAEGKLDIIFGYSQESEPSEVARLGLDKLNTNYIYTNLLPVFMKHGFKTECVRELKKEDLKNLETTWSKRLVFGQDRPVFHLEFSVPAN
jgi:16S rRNA (adenine(1408)-N(1))-methyltransferase